MYLAGIFGTLEQDLLFFLVALVLFGKRLPEVANTVGRKMYQFRKGLDEMKSEIAKPIREQLEAPIREAADMARQAARDAENDVRLAAERAKRDMDDSVAKARAGLDAGKTALSSSTGLSGPTALSSPSGDAAGTPGDSAAESLPHRNPFPYPGVPQDSTDPEPVTPETRTV